VSFPITAAEVLAIKRPEDLFPGTLDEGKALFRDLAKRWHPDHGGDDKIFAHINALHTEAVKKITAGTWGGKSSFRFEAPNDATYQIQYLKSRPFEFGHVYTGETHVVWIFDADSASYTEELIDIERNFKFANDKMRKDLTRSLPQNTQISRGRDGRVMVRVPKASELLALRDVLDHFGGKLDPKHAAWIGSNLYNLACWLSYSGMVHGDISVDNVWINPTDHSVALLGGWWFTERVGQKISKVSARTYDHLPYSVRVEKLATPLIDQELIRATVLELLDGEGPAEMRAWLTRPAAGIAVSVYEAWYKMLEKAFGKRRFTELKLTQQDIY
jgi:hypothetical protein